MAIFVFNKNSSDLYRIAASQFDWDNNKNSADEHFDIVTVSDDDFNNIVKGTKTVSSRDGNTITYADCTIGFHTRQDLTNHIALVSKQMNDWLIENSSKPIASNIETYKNYIDNINVSSIITDPSDLSTWDSSTNSYSDGTILNKSLEAYVIDQSQTAFHPLQLL